MNFVNDSDEIIFVISSLKKSLIPIQTVTLEKIKTNIYDCDKLHKMLVINRERLIGKILWDMYRYYKNKLFKVLII